MVVQFPKPSSVDGHEVVVPLCSRHDGSWWFDPASYDKAVEVCSRCAMRTPCLDQALAAGERLGVWGGLTPEQRAELPDAVVIPLRPRSGRRPR